MKILLIEDSKFQRIANRRPLVKAGSRANYGHARLHAGADRRNKISGVRYYTIKPIHGGSKFACTLCAHSVTTLDFASVNGNRRTQAAAAINQHAAFLHVRYRNAEPAKGR